MTKTLLQPHTLIYFRSKGHNDYQTPFQSDKKQRSKVIMTISSIKNH